MENRKINRDANGRFVSVKNETKAFLKDPYNEDGSIKIPEGFEVDMEKLKEGKILLRKKEVKKWEDIPVLKGCYIKQNSRLSQIKHRITNSTSKSTFIDTLHAKRAIAEAQISQLMPYYGGEITREEWRDEKIPKFSIVVFYGREMFDVITISVTLNCDYFLAFHTNKQASEFLENNEEIVRDYFMMS